MSEDIRNLVTIRQIDNIFSIKDADNIELAKIGGWQSVIKKNEYNIGDYVLFFEIDSFLPNSVPEFGFLMNNGLKKENNPNTNKEVEGIVLKTMTLRGELSQGLILPLSFGLKENSSQEEVNNTMLTLGVFKYEPIIEDENGIGLFPTKLARRTDSERIQNITEDWIKNQDSNDWYATEKIDGCSSTFIMKNNKIIIASRNLELSPEADTFYNKIVTEYNLNEIMPEGSILQGEIFGPGTKKNKLNVEKLTFRVFHWSCPHDNMTPEFTMFIENNSVPILNNVNFPNSIAHALETVHGMKSTINPKVQAEGIVWWNKTGKDFRELKNRSNFKVINNKYLMKNK